jgi:hypothetical protein
MGSITATCGHDITDEFDDNGIDSTMLSIMEFDGVDRCVSYGSYCAECRKLHREWGVVLEDEKAEQDWLNGKTEYPQ